MMQEPVDIETQISTLNLLDHRGIDWGRVQRTAYLIHQHFRYDYPGPVRDLKQHLLIVPSDNYGDQQRIVHRLDVSADVAETTNHLDEFGNFVIDLHIPHIEQSIDFEAWIVVERHASHGPHLLPRAALFDSRYLEPSALTQPDESLRQLAAPLLADEVLREPIALARRINTLVHDMLRYKHGVTSIHSPAAEALAAGYGVCQDFAHIMLVLCRLCGLPARYVSGHLLGEGGTHAWVEVLIPAPDQPDAAIALAFDPTHNSETDFHYLTIAVGRDYYDVAPTSGTFQAPYRGQLTAHKRVGPISMQYTETT
ncbi:MAG TPA: transglutaminase family protein [Ktedonobacteraceae bacterium]|nr:transglutaminase family protein [Ktedonobacteraceae bacterium]